MVGMVSDQVSGWKGLCSPGLSLAPQGTDNVAKREISNLALMKTGLKQIGALEHIFYVPILPNKALLGRFWTRDGRFSQNKG